MIKIEKNIPLPVTGSTLNIIVMEEQYMIRIHSVYGLKANQSLTSEDQQKIVLSILKKFREQAEELGRHKIKKELINSINDTIDKTLK